MFVAVLVQVLLDPVWIVFHHGVDRLVRVRLFTCVLPNEYRYVEGIISKSMYIRKRLNIIMHYTVVTAFILYKIYS